MGALAAAWSDEPAADAADSALMTVVVESSASAAPNRHSAVMFIGGYLLRAEDKACGTRRLRARTRPRKAWRRRPRHRPAMPGEQRGRATPKIRLPTRWPRQRGESTTWRGRRLH